MKASFHFIGPTACLLIVLGTMMSISPYPQKDFESKSIAVYSKTVQFGVWHQDKKIGWIKLDDSILENKRKISLQSEISTRLIISYTIIGKEESTFEDGQLLHSSLLRHWNGKEKANKKSWKTATGYRIEEKGQSSLLSIPPVRFNLLCLYFQEPKGVAAVYSDNYSKYFPIRDLGNGQYALTFPDRVFQKYFYKEGILEEVAVTGPFYKIRFLLQP